MAPPPVTGHKRVLSLRQTAPMRPPIRTDLHPIRTRFAPRFTREQLLPAPFDL